MNIIVSTFKKYFSRKRKKKSKVEWMKNLVMLKIKEKNINNHTNIFFITYNFRDNIFRMNFIQT